MRAQYAAGHSGGEDVPGYLEEDGVREGSTTETFAALRLEVDNWRWAGVPFYLRAGKRLARKITEIAVTLKPVPHLAFSQDGSLGVKPNQLVLTLQPNEGVTLQLGAKIPGTRMRIRPVNMEFLYGTSFMSQSPEAYERLIMDAMRGDPTLFTRNDEVEAQWRICDPILQAWEAAAGPAAAVRGGLAGAERGGRRAARRPPLARDLIRCPPSATRSGASRDTTPDAIEAALRGLLAERHAEDGGFLPARVLNMVAFVESEYSGEIANRLRGVGRYHASRLVVLSYEPRRTRLDAHASVAAEGEAAARRHRAAARDRDRRARRSPPRRPAHDRRPARRLRPADAAVVAPRPSRGRRQALLPLAQATLLDSVDEPVWHEAIDRANTLSDRVYVVDLAWLRSTPWRERIAATFDPPALRGELERDLLDRDPPPPRLDGRGRCCWSAGWPRAWAGG